MQLAIGFKGYKCAAAIVLMLEQFVKGVGG